MRLMQAVSVLWSLGVVVVSVSVLPRAMATPADCLQVPFRQQYNTQSMMLSGIQASIVVTADGCCETD